MTCEGSRPSFPANIEMLTSGKSSASEADIPWFESKHLSQIALVMELVYIGGLNPTASNWIEGSTPSQSTKYRPMEKQTNSVPSQGIIHGCKSH